MDVKVKKIISSPGDLPVSFLYDGKKIKGISGNWLTNVVKRRIDSKILLTDYMGVDFETGLR